MATSDPDKGPQLVRGLYGVGSKGVVVEGNHPLKGEKSPVLLLQDNWDSFPKQPSFFTWGRDDEKERKEGEKRNIQWKKNKRQWYGRGNDG